MPTESLSCWEEDLEPAERVRRMVKAAKQIADLPAECYRRDYDIFNVRLYENNPMVQLYDYAGQYYSDTGAAALPPVERSKNNKAKAAIDTLSAQVASTDQRARFMVVDGRSNQRRRARQMQNFADGLVHELELHALRKRAFIDACILESGVGGIQFYRDGNRCMAQRVLATEFSVDPRDGLVDGLPRTMYRQRPMPREDALRFAKDNPAAQAAVKTAPSIETSGVGDYILVYECWHLPSAKGAGDGWHLMGIEQNGGDLICEEHTRPYHDVVWLKLEDRFTTSWGLSIMSQVRDLQLSINANTYRIDRATKLFTAGHLYVNRNAKIKKTTLTNEIGTVWEGNGDTPPTKLTYQAVTPELYAQVETDGRRIFENTGISFAAAQGETNAGLNASAAAKREDTAKSDKRNSVRQQRWEQNHLDCVKVALAIVRDIVTSNDKGQKRDKRSSGSTYKVSAPDKRGLTVTDWKDAALDEESYVLQTKAASPIPTDPGGLQAFGREMVELGAWTPQQLAGYMQDLDADGRVNRESAQERRLEKVFESMLYDDVAAARPDEFTNPMLAMKLGLEYLAQGEDDEVPEKHLERVRRYLRQVKMIAKASAPQPAPAPTEAAPPLAAVA